MPLSRFPRRRYTSGRTPIEPLPRLGEALGGPALWIKRDDMLGLAGGGNKARKLEFLMADALARGADSIITTGAVQSNHCRMTVSAASREGLACHLVLETGDRPPDPTGGGNAFLDHLIGFQGIHFVPDGPAATAAMEQLAAELRAKGRRPYTIPRGGSSAIGDLGYVAAAAEIEAQALEMGVHFDAVVVASGSGGTHAGLHVGLNGIEVVGICVRAPLDEQRPRVRSLVDGLCTLLDRPPVERPVILLDEFLGDGYARPTAGTTGAVQLAARLEGVLLDPVYTGKAMSGLIALARRKRWAPGQNVLFLHTGGWPLLFA